LARSPIVSRIAIFVGETRGIARVVTPKNPLDWGKNLIPRKRAILNGIAMLNRP